MNRKAIGGSIASIGSTGLVASGIEYGGGGVDWLELHFFQDYKNGTKKIGQLWKNAITSYLKKFGIEWRAPAESRSSIDAKMVQGWILFGDPTLKIGGYHSVGFQKEEKGGFQ
jgi:hypothetical protein